MITFSEAASWVSGLLVSVWGWGWTDPAEEVTVSFGGRTERGVANAVDNWEVSLPALEPTSTPAILTVSGRNTLKVEDVLIGEV